MHVIKSLYVYNKSNNNCMTKYFLFVIGILETKQKYISLQIIIS
jgi:hypothetical protein